MKTKKHLILVTSLLIAGFLSCTDDLRDDNYMDTCNNSNSDTRSIAEAVHIAQDAALMLDENNTPSRRKARFVNMTTGIKMVTSASEILSPSQRRRTNSSINPINVDTLLYIINYEDDMGFAVVSAKKGTTPLLAVTESGHYSPEQATDNEGLNLFLEMAKNYVAYPFHTTRHPQNPILTRDSITPRIQVAWGQEHDIYSRFTINERTGCVNTSIGMLMSYYRHPTFMTLTFPDTPEKRRPNSIEIDWDSLLMVKNKYIKPANSSDLYAYTRVLPCLLRQLGHLNNSTYWEQTANSAAHTSTAEGKAQSTLTQLGYTVGPTMFYTYNTHFYELLAEDSVIILMTGKKNIHSSLHMWIVDGYKHLGPMNPTVGVEAYYHINWGWDGSANGYFNPGVFDTSQPVEQDILEQDTLQTPAIYTTNLKYFTVKK